MEHAIIGKLRRELREPITSERQVTYLLVEIRKLMEIRRDRKSYESLRFACDWVVHTSLSGPAAQAFVNQVDKHQQSIEAIHNSPPGGKVDTSSFKPTGEILSLSKIRAELSAYLQQLGLNSRLADDDGEWADFVTHYAGVVEDCPLKCKSKGLTHVDEVVLQVVQIVADPATRAALTYQLVIEWQWTSKNTGARTLNQQFY